MKIYLDSLAMSQIDRRLNHLRSVQKHSLVSGGWIKYIRKALGLTLAELSKLIGLSPVTISQAEKREVEGKVTLTTLRKFANAMDCDLVYSFVPKKSVAETIKFKAREKAIIRLKEAGLHMKLEDQKVEGNWEERIERLANELIKSGDVW